MNMPIIKDEIAEDYIVIKGRSGIEYFDANNNEYFIDSEMVVSEDYDIAIYPESLIQINKNNTTSEVKNKKLILERICKLCRQGNIKSRSFLDQ